MVMDMVRKNSKALHKSRLNVAEYGENKVIKRVVLTVIALAIVAVAVMLVCTLMEKNGSISKATIERMAADYYENYTYEKSVNDTMTKEEIAKMLGKYEESGLSKVSLRQLILNTGSADTDEAKNLKRHCDEDKTNVIFYPQAPYEKKSYRMEFRYECDFED